MANQNTDKIKILLKEVKVLEEQKKWVQLLSKYRIIIKYDPANYTAIQKIKEIEKKINQEKTISQKKTLAKQYEATGKKFVKENEFSKAIEQYELGKEVLPDPSKWNSLIKTARKAQKVLDEKKRKELRKNIESNYNKGLAFSAGKRYREAISAFQRVIKDANFLGMLTYVEQTQELLKKVSNALVKQEEEFVNVQSTYYNLVQSLKTLGLRHIEKEDYKNARKFFEQITDLFPHNLFANRYIAVCKIKINPLISESLINDFIADIKKSIRRKDNTNAKRIIDVLLFIDPKNSEVIRLRGQIENKTSIFASNTSKSDVKKIWDRALSAQQANNRKLALRLVKRILKTEPGHSNARKLLSRLESGKITRQVPKAVPKGARKAYTQGIIHYNNGAIRNAIRSFQIAVNIFPGYTKAAIALKKCRRYSVTR